MKQNVRTTSLRKGSSGWRLHAIEVAKLKRRDACSTRRAGTRGASPQFPTENDSMWLVQSNFGLIGACRGGLANHFGNYTSTCGNF